MSSSEPVAVGSRLELIESVGGKCPNGHEGATWRILRSAEKPIVTQWFRCDVCSVGVIAAGTHVWPKTVAEALVALAAKPPRVRTALRVIDRDRA